VFVNLSWALAINFYVPKRFNWQIGCSPEDVLPCTVIVYATGQAQSSALV